MTEMHGVRVTTPERTVTDSINMLGKIIGLEELLRCLALMPALNEEALVRCLAEYRSAFLYQKTGDIAQALGMNAATVRSRLSRGREKLKEHLEERGYGDANSDQ